MKISGIIHLHVGGALELTTAASSMGMKIHMHDSANESIMDDIAIFIRPNHAERAQRAVAAFTAAWLEEPADELANAAE